MAGDGADRQQRTALNVQPLLPVLVRVAQTGFTVRVAMADYYRLLQTVRDEDTWEDWVLYLLEAVEQTAGQTIATIQAIKAALLDYKHRIRAGYRFYSQI